MSVSDIKAGKAFFVLSIKTEPFEKGLSKSAKKLEAFSERINEVAKHLLKVGMTLAVPLTMVGKEFLEFDDKMRKVKAISRSTGAEFEKLTKRARELGATTSFTAQEVAGAMINLARVGYSTQQIQDSIQSVLYAARATDTPLEFTAETITKIANSFRMGASEAGRVADVLVSASNMSATSMEELSEAFKMAAPTAVTLGESIEDTAAAIALLANVGINSSIAGTALRKMYTQLGQADVERELRSYGIAAKDAFGNVRKLKDVLLDLLNEFGGAPTGTQVELFTKIFGIRGALGGIPLTRDIKGLQALSDAISQSGGIAQRTAEEMDKGIGGAFRMLNSRFESLKITLGQVLSESFINLMNEVKGVLGSIEEWAEENKDLLNTLFPITVNILKVAAALLAFRAVVKTAYLGIRLISGTWLTFMKILNASTLALNLISSSFSKIGSSAIALGTGISKGFHYTTPNIIAGIGKQFDVLSAKYLALSSIMKKGLPGINVALDSKLDVYYKSISRALNPFKKYIVGLNSALKSMANVAVSSFKTTKIALSGFAIYAKKVFIAFAFTANVYFSAVADFIKNTFIFASYSVQRFYAAFLAKKKELVGFFSSLTFNSSSIKSSLLAFGKITSHAFDTLYESGRAAFSRLKEIAEQTVAVIAAGVIKGLGTASAIFKMFSDKLGGYFYIIAETAGAAFEKIMRTSLLFKKHIIGLKGAFNIIAYSIAHPIETAKIALSSLSVYAKKTFVVFAFASKVYFSIAADAAKKFYAAALAQMPMLKASLISFSKTALLAFTTFSKAGLLALLTLSKTAVKGLVVALLSIPKGLAVCSTAFVAFGAKAIVALAPLALAIAAIGAAIYAVYRLLDGGSKEFNVKTKYREEYETMIQKYDEDTFAIESLNRFNEAQEHTRKEMNDAEETIKSLAQSYGDLGISIDETTGKIIGLQRAQEKMHKIQLEERILALQKKRDEALKNESGKRKELKTTIEDADDFFIEDTSKPHLHPTLNDYFKHGFNPEKTRQILQNKYNEKIDELGADANNFKKEAQLADEKIKLLRKQLQDMNEALEVESPKGGDIQHVDFEKIQRTYSEWATLFNNMTQGYTTRQKETLSKKNFTLDENNALREEAELVLNYKYGKDGEKQLAENPYTDIGRARHKADLEIENIKKQLADAEEAFNLNMKNVAEERTMREKMMPNETDGMDALNKRQATLESQFETLKNSAVLQIDAAERKYRQQTAEYMLSQIEDISNRASDVKTNEQLDAESKADEITQKRVKTGSDIKLIVTVDEEAVRNARSLVEDIKAQIEAQKEAGTLKADTINEYSIAQEKLGEAIVQLESSRKYMAEMPTETEEAPSYDTRGSFFADALSGLGLESPVKQTASNTAKMVKESQKTNRIIKDLGLVFT